MEDRFSCLPDDILLSIVSLLQFNEAARTSILSRRWVNLWKGTGRLDFQAGAFFSGINMLHDSTHRQRGHLFADWIHQVVNYSPRSATLDEFVASDSMPNGCAEVGNEVIDGWINFALQKDVKKLDLNVRWLRSGLYYFPSLALRNANCKSLVVLRLKFVGITGDDIEHFAANCPYLEELMVSNSQPLIDLDIKTPMSRLKLFEVRDCFRLKRMQLYAPNLLSSTFFGGDIKFMPLKKDVLCLDKLSAGNLYLRYLLFKPSEWWSYQVKRLELDQYMLPVTLFDDRVYPHRIVKFGNLRELFIRYEESPLSTALWFTSIIEASPLLHSLHVEMIWGWLLGKVKVEFPGALIQAIEENKHSPIELRPHNLRTILLTECCASPATIKLIIYLVANATCLEKLTIHLANGIDYERDKFVEWIMEMKTKLPLETELVII